MLLVDTQSGKPTKEEGLRVIGSPDAPDGVLAPKSEVERVRIGTRARIEFTDVALRLTLPQWTVEESAPAAHRGDTGVGERSPFSRTPKPYYSIHSILNLSWGH